MTRREVPRALRILHVDAAREWRGGERQLLLLAQGLRERGHEPLVAVRPASPLLQRLKAEGLATAAFAMRSDLDLLAVRRLRRLLATWRPHIVHAHDSRGHSLALATLLGNRQSIPLVVTRRSAARPRSLLRYGARVARFIACSAAARDALLAAHVPADRISVALPGVSAGAATTSRDWRAECGWPASTVVVAVVGPITRERESDHLRALLRAIPHDAADRLGVVVLGGHATGAARLGAVRIFRAGFVHDVPRALSGLDLLLHPGGAEGVGTAVVEAMALGVPSVAFATGGLGEIVRDGVDGALVPAGNVAAFGARIAGLVIDTTGRRELAARAPARAREFGPERMVDTVLSAYRDLLERSAV